MERRRVGAFAGRVTLRLLRRVRKRVRRIKLFIAEEGLWEHNLLSHRKPSCLRSREISIWEKSR